MAFFQAAKHGTQNALPQRKMETRKVLNGYVPLTYGPVSSKLSASHPAARQQVNNLRAIAQRHGIEARCFFEPCRVVRSLDDLPVLKKLLAQFQTAPDARLFIDDLQRLFKNCRSEHRAALLRELQGYGDNLVGIRQKLKSLNELNAVQLDFITNHRLPSRFDLARQTRASGRDPAELKKQTSKATRSSATVRKRRADSVAAEIHALKSELTSKGLRTTNSAIATEANNRGIRTTTNRPWTASTVFAALKRMDAPKLCDQYPG